MDEMDDDVDVVVVVVVVVIVVAVFVDQEFHHEYQQGLENNFYRQ
jgi:hypothetical protein